MKRGGTSNDNRELEDGVLDPDRHYVDDYVAKACAHFKELGINRETIADAMLTELFKMLEGNPFRSPGDEGALRADQGFLWSMKHRIVPMSEQWDRGWIRTQYEKRPTFKFNRAAALPQPPLPPRLVAPPADYDPQQHVYDLMLLKLRRGHVYTEKEVLTRYRRKMLRTLKNRHVERNGVKVDRVKSLTAAKKRVLGWIRRTQHLVTVQATN